MRRSITLAEEDAERAVAYGQRIVAFYGSEVGQRSRSRGLSGPWGAERDWVRQADGKLGEVAFARYCGLNPDTALNWDAGRGGDGGFDVQLPSGVRADVKTTEPNRRLIWSREKNSLFEATPFDVLVSVTASIWTPVCSINGFVSKAGFAERKRIAGAGDGLAAGTWWMRTADLSDVELLLEEARRISRIRAGLRAGADPSLL